MGKAASDLVRRGAENDPRFRTKNGWTLFELPPGAPPLNNEKVERWEKVEDEEEHRRAFSLRR